MKQIILLFLITPLILLADAKMDIYKLYKAKDYEAACIQGEPALARLAQDEEFVSIYAFSCLQADQLDKLALPITYLKSSSEARANAAYFAVILMQKELLMHALLDQYDLNAVKLPTSEYLLSTVYNLYSNDINKNKRRRYNYVDKDDPKKRYRLYITKGTSTPKMIIEEYYDTLMTKRHIYL